MTRARFGLVTLALLAAACGKKKTPAAKGRPAPKPAPIGRKETGLASWYGNPYHGRQAANGEIYDMEKMTAAHKTLPFNTWVRVKNLANGKTVEVRITDRGPFVSHRIIDLSHAAAVAIDLVGPGVAKVQLVVIRKPANPEPEVFGVQVGAFASQTNAERMLGDMRQRWGAARIVQRQGSDVSWRVIVGREVSEESAEALAQKIRASEKVQEAYVVRIDAN